MRKVNTNKILEFAWAKGYEPAVYWYYFFYKSSLFGLCLENTWYSKIINIPVPS